MKKVLFFLTIAFLCAFDSNSQVFKDSVYIHLTNFLYINGELELEEIRNKPYKDLIFIKNLVDSENAVYGIYTFYATVHDEVRVNVFIVDNDKFEIFDMSKVNACYSSLFLLFEKYPNDFNRINILRYLHKVSCMFDLYEEDSLGNLLIKVTYGDYSYFINIKNMLNPKGFLVSPVRRSE